MAALTHRELQHLFEQLRKGLVPERGVDAIAVGVEKERGELRRQLDLAADGEGTIKFLRGGYGCGKTFMSRLALLDAQRRGFATSFVVVSDNDLHFHRFDDVYRKVMTELSTSACPRGALGDILDRWIGAVEERLIDSDADEDADDFDDKVLAALEGDLAAKTAGRAPQDFIRVIQTIFQLKQKGEHADAGALVSWLGGSGNVAAASKRIAGIKGDIGSRVALDYLSGVLEIVKAAGYKGLVIVIDEAETILRMRSDTRGKSLNGIRQIADAAGSFPGLLWLFTGTPEFFDTRRGVAGLPPLHDRIGFKESGGIATVKQAQLQLKPFDAARLRDLAARLREHYPTQHPARVKDRVSPEFIERLVADVTAGFKGDVGVVPRQFLREFVTQMDLVDENDDYFPMAQYGFSPTELSATEEELLEGTANLDGDDDLMPVADVW